MFMHKTIPSLVGLLSQVSLCIMVYNVPIFAIFTNVKVFFFFFFAGGGGGGGGFSFKTFLSCWRKKFSCQIES